MRSPAMDPSSFSGFVLDPSKCSKLSVDEKRELVYELTKCSQGAPEMLQSWSRRDLLEVLCAEMGKERKYTGLTKYKLIEHLLRIVSEKKSGKQVEEVDSTSSPHSPSARTPSKRRRKNESVSSLPIGTNNSSGNNGSEAVSSSICCQNLACRAIVSPEDAFCKRCSCCICHKYDDNKDPSVWLVCSSDPPSQGDSCGLSCHLECALKHEKAGIAKTRRSSRLDGSFFCVSCGKINDLLGCCRKQLVIAKDARRVDVLCHRISLSHKLLSETEKYRKLHDIVDAAFKKLEAEVGPLNGLPSRMARGIVNRLSSGAEVQKLCVSAIESLDCLLSSASQLSSEPKPQKLALVSLISVRFEEISSTSITVVVGIENNSPLSEEISYTLRHRKMDVADYPNEPTCKLLKLNTKFRVSELAPATEYMFKVVAFSKVEEVGMREAGVKTYSNPEDVQKSMSVEVGSSKPKCGSPKTNSSDLTNPSSEGDGSNNTAACGDLNKLPENCLDCYNEPGIPDVEKSSELKETSHSKDTCNGIISNGTEATAQEENRGHSASTLDEEPNSKTQTQTHKDPIDHSADQNQASDNQKSPARSEMAITTYRQSDSAVPATPSKPEAGKEGSGRNARAKVGSGGLESWLPKLLMKKGPGNCDDLCKRVGLEGDYEYCVKVVRWLECKGHIETNFRVKFLTWFSLRATVQERRVVSVFVDTLIDDPPSLAGQLVDTFSEGISSKKPPPETTGFCMKLWH